jgi:hypothetical protein
LKRIEELEAALTASTNKLAQKDKEIAVLHDKLLELDTENHTLKQQLEGQEHGANRVDISREEFIKNHQDKVKRDVVDFRKKLADE